MLIAREREWQILARLQVYSAYSDNLSSRRSWGN